MPRDMRGTGRYPPQPRFPPFAFYSAVRLGDPELLSKIMAVDPYFVTQDNGAGAPLHFAVTYRSLDMAHHLLNNGAAVNQRDSKSGWTPLHRAAHLAHLDGYLEIYEYLLSRGADPSILSNPDDDDYLNPGAKSALDVAVEDEGLRAQLTALNDRYSSVPKAPVPHPDIGCWWTLYDYGQEEVATWPADYVHAYPEVHKRRLDREAARAAKAAKKAAAASALDRLRTQDFKLMFSPTTDDPSISSASHHASSPQPLTLPTSAAAATTTTAAAAAAAAAGTAAAMPETAASLPVALLFPGQGSQSVGMLSGATATIPAVAAMLQEAESVLGYDVLDLIAKGPKERLDDTSVAQPALFVANLAALEVLRGQDADVVNRCRATAGLSLGEYSALVAAGAMSFSDGLKVVKARGAAMAAAAAGAGGSSGSRPHGMLSVVGLSDEQLQQLCGQAVEACGAGTVCVIANYLFPQGRVVSGHNDALDVVAAAAGQLGALKVARLAVSGAFHTSLMEPAREALMQVLASVEIRAPAVPVLSNVTAAPFPSEPAAIRELLGRQLVEPVRWEDTLKALLATQPPPATVPATASATASSPAATASVTGEGGCSRLYEVGPGHQIKAMVRRISSTAWKEFKNVAAA